MKLRAGTRLLLDLAGPRPAGAILPDSVSWPEIEVAAVDLGLAPLLDHGIRRRGIEDRVPAETLRHLATIRRLTAVRNGVLLHALRRIEVAAAENNLPLIVLKGGDFVQTLYPDPSLRVLIDLDLLLIRDDALRLERQLPGLGFSTGVAMDGDWFERNLHHGLAWHGRDDGVILEVHWDLARPSDPFLFPVAGLFATSEPLEARIPGGAARSTPARPRGARRLSPSDSLEYLAAHLFRHLTTPDGAARSLVDAAWLLDHADAARIDWSALRARAAERGTAVPLALVLEVMEALYPGGGFGARARLFGGEAAAGDLATARRLMEAMFALPVRQPPAIVSGLTGLGQAEGIAGKARFLMAGLFPKSRDVNRDLSGAEARLPLPFRYGALLAGYARELARIGPAAAVTAYRLGRLRRRLMDRRPGPPSGARP